MLANKENTSYMTSTVVLFTMNNQTGSTCTQNIFIKTHYAGVRFIHKNIPRTESGITGISPPPLPRISKCCFYYHRQKKCRTLLRFPETKTKWALLNMGQPHHRILFDPPLTLHFCIFLVSIINIRLDKVNIYVNKSYLFFQILNVIF